MKKPRKLSKNPWMNNLHGARDRCNNANSPCFKRYGGRGIRCLITPEEIKSLWFRDKAFSMKRPTLDRIDNDGNYEFKNCQFLENSANAKKSIDRMICRNGHSKIGSNMRVYQAPNFKYPTYVCKKCKSEYNRKYKLKLKALRPPRERQTKLKKQDIDYIWSVKGSQSTSVTAKKFGVCNDMIRKIYSLRAWKCYAPSEYQSKAATPAKRGKK